MLVPQLPFPSDRLLGAFADPGDFQTTEEGQVGLQGSGARLAVHAVCGHAEALSPSQWAHLVKGR